MKILLIISSLVLPLLMVAFQRKWRIIHLFFTLLALVSTLIFGNIAALEIYEIIRNKTVFMTTIHGLFLNPLFLATGSYLGIYLIYVLLLNVWLNRMEFGKK
ncbi:transposase [Oceanobacillus halophilus]|uniref:Transposase n=1 Tax=Oceanobacillus halophilus TaxID=930130 RepID=A0A494ZTB9_9BACI|nr:transposase [Oceanobacillus halophilus]RKQ29356.1 transposase [Oceanobacillus halophilus]